MAAGGHDEVNKLMLLVQAGAVALVGQGRGGGQEPAAQALGRNRGGEGFVEVGVAGHKEALVGQFVENDFGEAGVGFVNEGVQNGVLEPAEGGVGFNAVHVNVPAFLGEVIGITAGGLFVEITAIAGAADDGEPPGLWLQGKGGSDGDVPDDEGAVEVGVLEIALPGGEMELPERRTGGFSGWPRTWF